jgi:hypothetical protein
MLSRSITPGWIDSILIFGYVSLPFLLYLFLLVLVFDIFRLFNLLFRIIPIERLSSRRSRIIILLLLFSIPTGVVLAGLWNNNTIRVNEYSIQVPRRSSPLHHLKIALASDFHLKKQTNRHFMERFTQTVNGLNADILLIPGDVLEGDRQGERLEEFEQQFREVRTTYGSFACPGNHEYYGRRSRPEFFTKSGIVLLQDTSLVIHNSFTIVGRNDNHSDRRTPIGDLMHSAPDTLPVIVLDHRPTDLDAISRTNADIVLCGHTHDGQLFPLNLITNRVYEISWGYKKIWNSNVFVTCGIQLWGPPVRTAGESEIMLIDVEFTDR